MKSKTWTLPTSVLPVLSLALLLAACPPAGEPGPGPEEQARADAREVLSQLEPNQAMELDFANDVHHRFFMNQLRGAGDSEEKSPRLFQVLAQMRADALARGPLPVREDVVADPTTTVPVNAITSLSSPAPTVDSSALSSVPGGTLSTTLTLTLFDASHNPIGQNLAKQFNQGELVPVATNGTLPAGDQAISASSTYSYVEHDGTPHVGVVKLSTSDFPNSITNDDPAQKKTRPNPLIKVCLGRQQFADCDYDEPMTGTPGHPNVIFPIKGLSQFNGNVTPPSPLSNPTNAFDQIFIVRNEAGGGCVLPITDNFFQHTTTSGNTFSWDLEPADFGPVCFGNGESVTYTFVVGVTVNGVVVPTTITNAPDSVPGPGTVVIPPMTIVFGCLAAGTEVRMADGSQKKIDDVVVREQVLSNNEGAVLTVEDTIWGTEEIPLIRLEDDQGHSLLLTEGHPVVTAGGVKLAKELKVGDEVVVDGGTAQLTKVEEEAFDGKVYNVNLGIETENVTRDNTTLFANGFLVGDNRMQTTFGKEFKTRKENVLEALPPEWHQDYHNWLKEQG